MSKNLHPVIEKFYLSALSYAGLVYSDGIIKNANEKFGPITIDGKHLTLPYFENLKNPDGKIVFHLLNENYVNPENTVFNFYKTRLVLELNIRLTCMIVNLITVASDIQMQQKIKSGKLIELISKIGETDMTLIENFLSMVKASKKVNDESYLFDIYLKKNGEINGVPYAAIGKINFIAAKEIHKALNEKEQEYRVFGYKLRKKDLVALNNIFNILFPDFLDNSKYIEGTNNKVFRYLNILLKTSYMIASRINEMCELLEELKEPSLRLEDCYSDLEWSKTLKDLYDMTNEIRLIPNQTDIAIESKNSIHKLNVDESKVSAVDTKEPSVSRTEFVPPSQQQFQTSNQKTLSPEDIIKGNIPTPVPVPGMPVVNPAVMPAAMPTMSTMSAMAPAMMPNMMPGMVMPQQQIPSWIIQETMNANTSQANQMPPNVVMTAQGPMLQTPTGLVPYHPQVQPVMGSMPNQVPMQTQTMYPQVNNFVNTTFQPQQSGTIMPNPLFAR